MNDLITRDMILLDLEASDKSEVIQKLSKAIEGQGRLLEFEGFVEQVNKREETFPTAIGFNVAIPHGKCDYVKKAALAFARLKKEVKWSEEENVKYVFLIGVSEKEAGNKHLQILAQLSRSIMKEEFREKLNQSRNIEEILSILSFEETA